MKQVLIVEDESTSALLLKNYFIKHSFDVLKIVPSGEEAIEIAKNGDIDLVVMDIQLSGKINGIEAMKKILELQKIRHIYCSSYKEKEIIDEANTTSPLAYMTKPLDLSLMNILIRQFI